MIIQKYKNTSVKAIDNKPIVSQTHTSTAKPTVFQTRTSTA